MSDNPQSGDAGSYGNEPLTCLRCGGAMTQGFVLDTTHGGFALGQWMPGTPQRSFWTSVKRTPEALPIGAFRCAACGRLELFADRVFALQ